MIATILHWPSRLDGAKDWSQGLWRAQVGARVVEFFGTKPCGDWAIVCAALLEQLQQAMATGAVTVIHGPPLEPLQTAAAPLAPRSATRLGLVPSGRHDEAHRHRQAVFQRLSDDGRLLFVDGVSGTAPGRHDLVVAPQWRDLLVAMAMQPGDRLALVLDERQHPAYVIRPFPIGRPPVAVPAQPVAPRRPLPAPPDSAARHAAEIAADSRRIRRAAEAIIRELEADERARQAAQAPAIQQLSLLP